jgi:UDP-N-acetylmuramate: L-alanyl-gamma-D-glutamyl-meso-diaminopimelate ligase
MHLHILGICGTFMGGLALLARALGHRVTGSDANVYPPMSTQLEAAGIALQEGYEPAHLQPAPDLVVVGNAMGRGNPAVEYMLDAGLRYTSGPQWLAEQLLAERWVLAVAGTHGKTTTASMLTWILERAGLEPGYLIGGVPANFGDSARLGGGKFFVIEADEYDTAFFDKRSKFVHYRPRTLVLNNLEFDHADIFDDLAMIQRQFHHLVRTVPASGQLVVPARDASLEEVLAMGAWTPKETFALQGPADWQLEAERPDHSRFQVMRQGVPVGVVDWGLVGRHNAANALAALAAAAHAGVEPALGVQALSQFRNVKRRLELRGEVGGVRVYDDFAHHPTAIRLTLDGLRQKVGSQRIIAILEPRSNTMRMGVHSSSLADSLRAADEVLLFAGPGLGWDPRHALSSLGERGQVFSSVATIVDSVSTRARPGDHILIMSNGGFEHIHQRLLEALAPA